ncbi:DeoR/GlpR family DNA-binding transcription regulator [Niallia sp. NCCP-28]|uniref:DeoR/GlpR family DNA-binding transcription regulator n=1 Tax=Niallia sp. NCCP-28 TaxID=2934712 RepID=UPI0020892DA3|nr:DeoR/GlpR family DNA-binding transcription regulator [Niallia sp. NCCP-28]GKU83289.1 DeoR family transcriptional regulator [Niallia sp. NCCP-28]
MEKKFAPERRKIILEQLQEKHRVIIKDLSKEIKVSEATLRTDLSKMEEEGLLKRTHGGAILVDSDSDTSFYTREGKNKQEKNIIANIAKDYIKDGQCIMFDSSSTALELVRLLNDSSLRLTVVTSGINTALELRDHPSITVILLGGIVKKGSFSLEGNLGVSILNKINIDILFTSANGFSFEAGLTDFSVYEVELKKAMVEASNKIIALLDHTKLNKKSIAAFAEPDKITTIITDHPVTMEFLEKAKTYSIDVVSASKNKLDAQ